MTAKDTQFGRKTFTSWLIESVGTVPIKRKQEHGDAADNTAAMGNLVKVCNGSKPYSPLFIQWFIDNLFL
jgi:hypothetical protein